MPIFASGAIVAATALGMLGGQAAPATTGQFRVAGVEFVASLPSGFCLPTGLGLDVAQFLAAADTVNVTDLTVFTCGDEKLDSPEYYLIKTPNSALLATMSREEFLAAMGTQFDKPDFAAALASNSFNDQAAQSLEKMVGSEIGITGAVKPLGRDETCAYMGGILELKSEKLGSYKRAVGLCMTIVSGKIIAVYRYGADDGAKSVVAMVAKAKAFALGIKPKQ